MVSKIRGFVTAFELFENKRMRKVNLAEWMETAECLPILTSESISWSERLELWNRAVTGVMIGNCTFNPVEATWTAGSYSPTCYSSSSPFIVLRIFFCTCMFLLLYCLLKWFLPITSWREQIFVTICLSNKKFVWKSGVYIRYLNLYVWLCI